MSTEHYDLRFPDCNKSFSSSFHCSQTFKQWVVKWNNGNIATSVSTRWMWWKSSVILSAAQLGRLFAEPPRRQTVCWSKDKAGVENSETHRYSFNTFPILSGQLELEWGGGGGDGGGALNLEELKSKKALEEKKEEKLSAKSARMEGRNHGNSKSLTKTSQELRMLSRSLSVY